MSVKAPKREEDGFVFFVNKFGAQKPRQLCSSRAIVEVMARQSLIFINRAKLCRYLASALL